jgi:hypothetical protein
VPYELEAVEGMNTLQELGWLLPVEYQQWPLKCGLHSKATYNNSLQGLKK